MMLSVRPLNGAAAVLLSVSLAFVGANRPLEPSTLAGPAALDAVPPVPTGPTGEKPQSKVWFAQGHWWAVVSADAGLYLWKFDGETLQAQSVPGKLPQSKPNDACDVLAVGDDLLILAHNGTSQRLYKLRWQEGAYRLLDGFPVAMSLGGETSTVARDSTGRLWVAVASDMEGKQRRHVRVVWSVSADHLKWHPTGTVLEEGISSDDICALTTVGNDRIGVFWSDQVRDRFGFRVHHDQKPPEAWDDLEVVAQEKGLADDHVNLAPDDKGRVWAVTKDAKDRFTVWRRSPEGKWDLRVPFPQLRGTRPIIVVSDALDKVYVAYSDWTVTPGRIGLRTSPCEKVAFCDQTTLIAGPDAWNNVSGPKHSLAAKTGLLLIASTGKAVKAFLVKP